MPEIDLIPNLDFVDLELNIEIFRKVKAKRILTVATAPENRASPSSLKLSELRGFICSRARTVSLVEIPSTAVGPMRISYRSSCPRIGFLEPAKG